VFALRGLLCFALLHSDWLALMVDLDCEWNNQCNGTHTLSVSVSVSVTDCIGIKTHKCMDNRGAYTRTLLNEREEDIDEALHSSSEFEAAVDSRAEQSDERHIDQQDAEQSAVGALAAVEDAIEEAANDVQRAHQHCQSWMEQARKKLPHHIQCIEQSMQCNPTQPRKH
jgi:hypothetical protein